MSTSISTAADEYELSWCNILIFLHPRTTCITYISTGFTYTRATEVYSSNVSLGVVLNRKGWDSTPPISIHARSGSHVSTEAEGGHPISNFHFPNLELQVGVVARLRAYTRGRMLHCCGQHGSCLFVGKPQPTAKRHIRRIRISASV